MFADEVIEAMTTSAERYRTVRLTASTPSAQWRFWYDRALGSRVEHEDVTLDTLFEVYDTQPGRTVPPPDAVLGSPSDGWTFGTLSPGSWSPVSLLVDPALLVREAVLDVRGTAMVAGRRAALVSARARNDDIASVGLGRGAWRRPSIDVAVDVERGVLLAGPDVEVTEIAFDEAAPAELLRQWPRRGHTVLQRPVTLAEGAAAVSWPILLPTRLPEQSTFAGCSVSPHQPPTRLDALWHTVVDLSRDDTGITVVPPILIGEVPTAPPEPWNPPVRRGDTAIEVMLKQGPQVRRLRDRTGWRAVVVDDVAMLTLARAPSDVNAVVVEREATDAVLISVLPISTLATIAASLASTQDPF